MNTFSEKSRSPGRAYRGRVQAAMTERGLKRYQVARKIGITPQSFTNKMNKKASFSEDEMIAIMQLFRWKSLGGDNGKDW